MSVDLQKTQYVSTLSGFKNKYLYDVSSAIPGYSLTVGTYVAVTITLTFLNPGAVLGDISSVQIKYDGLDTFWRVVEGFVFTDYPSSAVRDYEITTLTYFTNTSYIIYMYIVNETAGTVVVPAFTFRYRLNTFDSPF